MNKLFTLFLLLPQLLMADGPAWQDDTEDSEQEFEYVFDDDPEEDQDDD